MIFSSLVFLYIFLPAVLVLLALCWKSSYQNLILFLASLVFYAWGGISFTMILIGSILLNYVAGLIIDKYPKSSKITLTIAIVLNLGMLGYFKYANFFVDNLNVLTTLFGFSSITVSKVILPIGISFFTFQGISYLADVYRKTVTVQRNPIILGTYIALFPQLIAGPIIRYNTLESQFLKRQFCWENLFSGIKRFIFGLARKVLIANQLAVIADEMFARSSSDLTPLMAWIGIVCYALQIYHDFAGYSDMAIGLGKMFGFDFPENFNFPYIAQSIQDFWRRWHITLSAWFKDYLYIPLGGNRCSRRRLLLNLYIVFFCTGLWHGASWNFVIWGLLHGTFLVIERIGLNKTLTKIASPPRHLYTLIIVLVAWVFFRADTLPTAFDYVKTLFFINRGTLDNALLIKYVAPSTISIFVIAILGSTPLFSRLWQSVSAWNKKRSVTMTLQYSVLCLALIGVMVAVTCLLCVGSYNPFIYYRF